MAGELGPEIIETVVGRAEVKEVFPAARRTRPPVCWCSKAVIKKGLHARLTRDDVIVSKTTISSLRRFKDDVKEVNAGMECGVLWPTPTTSSRATISKCSRWKSAARTL
jgi:translation initiation factor IF-2